MRRFILALIIAAGLPVVALAQEAFLTGRVLRNGHIPVAGASVVYTHIPTGAQFETLTGPSGLYQLNALPLGTQTRPQPAGGMQWVVAGSVGASRSFYFRSVDRPEQARVYDILGRLTATIPLTAQWSGGYWSGYGQWDGRAAADGIYFATLESGSGLQVVRFVNLASGPAALPQPGAVAQILQPVAPERPDRSPSTLDEIEYRVTLTPLAGGGRFERREFQRFLHDGDNGHFDDSVHWAVPQHILFVGNSYTYYNGGVDQHLAGMVNSIHPEWHFEASAEAPGGYTLQNHWNRPATLNDVTSGYWDMVVLQEQSTRPVTDPDLMFAYARLLDSLISANGAQTAFYMTWARENDPAMINALARSYDSMGVELYAPVAPVGRAFAAALDADSTLDLYDSDGSHPSVYGTYLAVCVFYAALLRRDPTGIEYTSSNLISAADRLFLQTIAWQTVENFPPDQWTRPSTLENRHDTFQAERPGR